MDDEKTHHQGKQDVASGDWTRTSRDQGRMYNMQDVAGDGSIIGPQFRDLVQNFEGSSQRGETNEFVNNQSGNVNVSSSGQAIVNAQFNSPPNSGNVTSSAPRSKNNKFVNTQSGDVTVSGSGQSIVNAQFNSPPPHFERPSNDPEDLT